MHGETTFDLDTIRRHLSVVVLTTSRLIFVHADDHGGDEEHGDEAHGIATSESVPLSAVRSRDGRARGVQARRSTDPARWAGS